jgi:hypothetical protein
LNLLGLGLRDWRGRGKIDFEKREETVEGIKEFGRRGVWWVHFSS